mgnify:CR=1 FL=1
MIRSVVCAMLVLWAGAGAAGTAPGADAVQARLDQWLSRYDLSAGLVVALAEGAPWQAASSGKPLDQPVNLQSNSKPVTAHCVADLVAEGLLAWDDPLSVHLPGAAAVTVGAAVTHAGGIFPDGTQAQMPGWRNDPAPRWREAADQAAARPLDPRRGAFLYNNDNYALLGAVIEAVTGQPYLTACAARVLTPEGLSAQLSPDLGAYGPFGGLAMLPEEFARFHHARYRAPEPSAPRISLGGGAFYGLGMLSRARPDGAHNMWHHGMVCFEDGVSDGGSFVVGWGANVTVFVAYDGCASPKALAALEGWTFDLFDGGPGQK